MEQTQRSLVFLTTNDDKWRTAQSLLAPFGISLSRESCSVPEIQSDSVAEVALFGARWGATELGVSVIKVDAGYYIEGLGGFPGPFARYANRWFAPQHLLAALGSASRRIIVREAVAFAKPAGPSEVFQSEFVASLADAPQGEGTTLDRLLILPGFDRPQSLLAKETVAQFWEKHHEHYQELGEYLCQNLP